MAYYDFHIMCVRLYRVNWLAEAGLYQRKSSKTEQTDEMGQASATQTSVQMEKEGAEYWSMAKTSRDKCK